MNPTFLDLLACPETGSALKLENGEVRSGCVVTGALVNAAGRRYPIIRGIPRFVSEECYANSFGFEWNRWPRVQFESENTGRPMAGHTTRMWETITAVGEQAVRGRTIVEFGCGPGRFLDVVRGKGGRAVGIDMSLAVEAARRNFEKDREVLIVQGDVLRPPLRRGAFDGGYSIGVLHHTPRPEAGLRQLVNAVARGGWVSVCVYPKGEFYDYPSVARFRRLHHRLSPRWGYRPAMAYSYFSAYGLNRVFRKLRKIPGGKRMLKWLQREWLVCLDLPDARWSVLDIFDAITPSTASTHTGDEVQAWLLHAKCSQITLTPWCDTSFTAIAPAAAAQRAA
jgi:SAM-dependent methyltransferase